VLIQQVTVEPNGTNDGNSGSVQFINLTVHFS